MLKILVNLKLSKNPNYVKVRKLIIVKLLVLVLKIEKNLKKIQNWNVKGEK